jgi:3-oxoacyl-[acyl-carrier-protein] synthase II
MDISTACATGTNTIGEAYEMIYRGDADAIITGGTEASIAPVIFCGFINMRALSTRNDDPTRASRPFDRDRDGFVIGEGASVMILEELEHALARGAKIYCEVVGYATGNDAYHMVSPAERGTGAVRVMRAALRKAAERSDLCASEVDYVNAHGSSTPLNDKYETDAVKTVFGAHAYDLTMTSTKSMVGHLFGGAGSIEAFACVKAIETGWIPPTINLDNPDPECDLDYTPNVARQRNVRAAISNGFGLGGHNACVIFRRFSA